MKKILITITGLIAAALLFTGGAYAANQGWLNFEGDEQLSNTENDIDRIMEILHDVGKGKITAEEGVAQLTSQVNSLEGQVEHLENLLDGVTGENPGQKIQFLKDKVERLFNDNEELKTENAVLTTNLAASNKKIGEHEEKIKEHKATIESNKEAYDALEQTNIDIQNKLDNAIAEKGELETELSKSQGQNADLQALIDENNGYIQHLKDELARANDAAESVNAKSTEALEEAQQYQSEEE